MSWDGMLPPHPCERCGKPLSSIDRPAELYAGTHTGLCDACTHAPAYVKKILSDGIQVISYPPHCPSWRRDREEYLAVPGCTKCNGTGRLYKSVSYPTYNSFYYQCEECSNIYHLNPKRIYYSKRLRRICDAGESVYAAELKRQKLFKLAKKGEAPQDKIDEIGKPIMQRVDILLSQFTKQFNQKHKDLY